MEVATIYFRTSQRMDMKNRIYMAVLLAATSLFFPSLLLANPIVEGFWINPDYVLLYSVPFLLVMEGVILATLAKKSMPYFYRFVCAWALITTVTFLLLMASLEGINYSIGGSVGVCGEAVVTIIEAIALYCLLRSQKISREPEYAPSFVQCLLYSLIANTFSFTGGFLAVDLPQRINDLIMVLHFAN